MWFSLHRYRKTVRVCGEACLLSKKALKKITWRVLGARLKTDKPTIATKKKSPPPLRMATWMGHHWCLQGAASPWYIALDLCYIFWSKMDFPEGLRIHVCRGAHCINIAVHWQIVVCQWFAAPKLAGLRHLGHITGKGQRYESPKNGLSEANYLADAGCKVRRWCRKTAAQAGHTWRRPSPLATAGRLFPKLLSLLVIWNHWIFK